MACSTESIFFLDLLGGILSKYPRTETLQAASFGQSAASAASKRRAVFARRAQAWHLEKCPRESQSKPGIKMVYPEPREEYTGGRNYMMVGIVPY